MKATTATTTRVQELAAYITYAMSDMQTDEDEVGPFAKVLSNSRDGSRYQVRFRELPTGEAYAERCTCRDWLFNNPDAIACEHMLAFNDWHARIFSSVTKMPTPECFESESPWNEFVEVCASMAPVEREQAPHRLPSVEDKRAKSAKILNGKRAADCVTAYDAGWEAGKHGLTEDAEFQARVWMNCLKEQGYTLRAQQELREQYVEGYRAGQTSQPAPTVQTLTERMESAPLNGNRGFSLLRAG